MLAAIKQFFDKNIAGHAPATRESTAQEVRVATAALLLEMTRMDHNVKPAERDKVTLLIRDKFGLAPEQTEELIQLAEREAREATDYFQFTSLINKNFSAEEKEQVIEYMWQVAYADGTLDKYEEHLMRKIAELIYVPHSTFIAAKLRARPGGE